MEWRKIPGFGRYSVSEFGDVRRDACGYCGTKERPTKAVLNDRGYFKTSIIRDDDRNITRTIHSFVAMAFLGSRPAGTVICHYDGEKKNNHYTNLRYDTQSANIADALRHRTHPMGTRHPGAKLNDDKVREIRRLAA